jgi:hypothetical protein
VFNLQDRIREDSRTPTDPEIGVKVTNKLIRLEGKVPSQEAKYAAEEIARPFAREREFLAARATLFSAARARLIPTVSPHREVRNEIEVDPALVEQA